MERKAFVCSFCKNGLLGGMLYLDSMSVTYKTNKLTVDRRYRNFIIPIEKINEVTWKWYIFPVATFHLKHDEKYSFMIFNKKRFIKYFNEYKKN